VLLNGPLKKLEKTLSLYVGVAGHAGEVFDPAIDFYCRFSQRVVALWFSLMSSRRATAFNSRRKQLIWLL